MGRRHTPESFWDLVDKSATCWEWRGSIHVSGYGHVRWNNRLQKAHRVAYELAIGPIPEGLTLDHLCRNPPCVNPAHLEPVTSLENVRRAFLAQTACRNGGHPYEGNLIIDAVTGARRCRLCRNGKNAARRRERRRERGLVLVRGESHGNAKLTADHVLAIRAATGSQREIAERFGVSSSNVGLIKSRTAWAWLNEEPSRSRQS